MVMSNVDEDSLHFLTRTAPSHKPPALLKHLYSTRVESVSHCETLTPE